MCSERIFFIFIVVQPTSESSTSQQPTPEASLSIQPPEPGVLVAQVPELVEVPEAQPESKQVPTASKDLTSSVRNQGTGFVSSVINL